MKIAFAGKGGSGKTTLSSLFTRHLAEQGLPVVVIDADINQHLAEALGAVADPPPMGRTCRRSRSTCGAATRGSPRLLRWSKPPRPAAGPGCCVPAAPIRSTT
jgi:CO dehydrogenase nickel-insertion accessory protein CooC1